MEPVEVIRPAVPFCCARRSSLKHRKEPAQTEFVYVHWAYILFATISTLTSKGVSAIWIQECSSHARDTWEYLYAWALQDMGLIVFFLLLSSCDSNVMLLHEYLQAPKFWGCHKDIANILSKLPVEPEDAYGHCAYWHPSIHSQNCLFSAFCNSYNYAFHVAYSPSLPKIFSYSRIFTGLSIEV